MKYLLFLFVMLNQIAFGQTLISYEMIEEISTAEAASEYNVDNPQFAQRVYKVLYNTEHIGGAINTASGLVCIPIQQGRVFPTAVYQHGTANSRDEVPSRNVESSIGKILASLGYATVLADYIGLGDSEGVHPYIHSDSESSAAADLIIAMREVAALEGVVLSEQLFLTGYSQGGHASAALQKDIEAGRYAQINTVTAASHLSGPYSVSEKMPEFTLGDEPYQAVAYLPWVVLSLKMTYPDLMDPYELSDIFKPEFISPIEKFRDEEINLFSMNIALIGTLFSGTNTQILPKLMIQPEMLDSILNYPDHPFNQALARNDLVDWAPQAPTRLMGCAGDDQVWYENSLYAEGIMKANGATDVAAEEYGPNFNHGQCVEPVVTATIEFFEQYQEIGFYLNTDENAFDSCPPVVSHTASTLNINIDHDCITDLKIDVVSLDGRVILSEKGQAFDYSLDITSLSPGLYLLNIRDENGGLYNQKFIK